MSDASSAPNEQFFHALEKRRTRALVECDLAALEALHAPEYQLITPTGRVFTRDEYLGAFRDKPFYAAWEIVGAMSFRLSAQMAIVRYQARIQFPSGRVFVVWHMDSYERRPSGWQAVWSQATEAVAAAPQP